MRDLNREHIKKEIFILVTNYYMNSTESFIKNTLFYYDL